MLDTHVLPPRYHSVRRIARGGMGEVYVAEDGDLGRHVAVKVLDQQFATNAGIRRRFTREALAAARLSGHPHIVTIYDVGEWNGQPFMVMEHLAGGTLADRTRGRAVQPRLALQWLAQAAEALDAAHDEGIVHRDVKPANLIFDARDELHVADFGIARILDATGGTTAAGAVLGTAGYLSPEQARAEQATPASDVYALGVVAFELLTGVRPFARGSETAEALAHLNEPVPPASARQSSLPPQVDAVLARAMAKDPARRYRSAAAFVAALADAVGRGHATTKEQRAVAPTRIAAPPPPTRRLWPALVAAGLVLAAMAGVAAAVMTARSGRSGHAAPPARVVTRHVTTQVTGQARTITETVVSTAASAPATTAAGPSTAAAPSGSGRSLNDQGYRLYQGRRYAEALPFLQQAVRALAGSGPGDPYEAYANYNLGATLVALGRCAEAVPPLLAANRLENRSEARARLAQAQACASGSNGGNDQSASGAPAAAFSAPTQKALRKAYQRWKHGWGKQRGGGGGGD